MNSTDGTFTYTPPSSSFTGTVHVYFTATDNNQNSTNGDLIINVGPLVTDPVVLYDLENQQQAGGSLVGSVLTTDSHPTYTFSNFTIAANDGTIGTPDPTTGAFTYTPPAGSGFAGKVDIHYKVTDTTDNVGAARRRHHRGLADRGQSAQRPGRAGRADQGPESGRPRPGYLQQRDL